MQKRRKEATYVRKKNGSDAIFRWGAGLAETRPGYWKTGVTEQVKTAYKNISLKIDGRIRSSLRGSARLEQTSDAGKIGGHGLRGALTVACTEPVTQNCLSHKKIIPQENGKRREFARKLSSCCCRRKR